MSIVSAETTNTREIPISETCIGEFDIRTLVQEALTHRASPQTSINPYTQNGEYSNCFAQPSEDPDSNLPALEYSRGRLKLHPAIFRIGQSATGARDERQRWHRQKVNRGTMHQVLRDLAYRYTPNNWEDLIADWELMRYGVSRLQPIPRHRSEKELDAEY